MRTLNQIVEGQLGSLMLQLAEAHANLEMRDARIKELEAKLAELEKKESN
jgi:hypothetical protein